MPPDCQCAFCRAPRGMCLPTPVRLLTDHVPRPVVYLDGFSGTGNEVHPILRSVDGDRSWSCLAVAANDVARDADDATNLWKITPWTVRVTDKLIIPLLCVAEELSSAPWTAPPSSPGGEWCFRETDLLLQASAISSQTWSGEVAMSPAVDKVVSKTEWVHEDVETLVRYAYGTRHMEIVSIDDVRTGESIFSPIVECTMKTQKGVVSGVALKFNDVYFNRAWRPWILEDERFARTRCAREIRSHS